jgi:uncharacterized phage infection (PIP) family protein YhgE
MSSELVDAAAAQADSSSVDTAPQPAAPSPEDQADLQVPFHKHPRFQELIAQNREFRSTNGQLTQQVQQLTQAVQQMQRNAPNNGTPPNEEYVKAADALLKIMEVNPRLKALLGLADSAPQLMQGYQGVQELTQAQTQSLLRSGRQEISSLATKAGLPSSDEDIDLLEEMVAGVIRRTPGAEERFRQGDLNTVADAFKKISEGFVANLRRPAAQNVIDTKNKVRNLPPAPRGGLPGGSAPAKLDPNNPRPFEQSLHQRAMDMLANLTG